MPGRDERLALVEVPLFRAGMATAEIQSGAQVIETALKQIKRGIDAIELWQQAWSEVMAYPYRRKEEDDGG